MDHEKCKIKTLSKFSTVQYSLQLKHAILSSLAFIQISFKFVLSLSTDYDECAKRRRCKSNEICVNLPGSYNCSCVSGYQRVGKRCRAGEACQC